MTIQDHAGPFTKWTDTGGSLQVARCVSRVRPLTADSDTDACEGKGPSGPIIVCRVLISVDCQSSRYQESEGELEES